MICNECCLRVDAVTQSKAAVNGSPTLNDPHDAAAANGNGAEHTITKTTDTHDEESAGSTVGHENQPPDGSAKVESHGTGEPEEDEDEDSDEEDEEPALKYELLGSDIANLLEKDSASAIAIGARHMVSARLVERRRN